MNDEYRRRVGEGPLDRANADNTKAINGYHFAMVLMVAIMLVRSLKGGK